MLIRILLISMFSLLVSYRPSQKLGNMKEIWYFIESQPIYKHACVLCGLLLLFLKDIYCFQVLLHNPLILTAKLFHSGLILLLEIRGSFFQWAGGSRNKFILRRNKCFFFWMDPRWDSEHVGSKQASMMGRTSLFVAFLLCFGDLEASLCR